MRQDLIDASTRHHVTAKNMLNVLRWLDSIALLIYERAAEWAKELFWPNSAPSR